MTRLLIASILVLAFSTLLLAQSKPKEFQKLSQLGSDMVENISPDDAQSLIAPAAKTQTGSQAQQTSATSKTQDSPARGDGQQPETAAKATTNSSAPKPKGFLLENTMPMDYRPVVDGVVSSDLVSGSTIVNTASFPNIGQSLVLSAYKFNFDINGGLWFNVWNGTIPGGIGVFTSYITSGGRTTVLTTTISYNSSYPNIVNAEVLNIYGSRTLTIKGDFPTARRVDVAINNMPLVNSVISATNQEVVVSLDADPNARYIYSGYNRISLNFDGTCTSMVQKLRL